MPFSIADISAFLDQTSLISTGFLTATRLASSVGPRFLRSAQDLRFFNILEKNFDRYFPYASLLSLPSVASRVGATLQQIFYTRHEINKSDVYFLLGVVNDAANKIVHMAFKDSPLKRILASALTFYGASVNLCGLVENLAEEEINPLFGIQLVQSLLFATLPNNKNMLKRALGRRQNHEPATYPSFPFQNSKYETRGGGGTGRSDFSHLLNFLGGDSPENRYFLRRIPPHSFKEYVALANACKKYGAGRPGFLPDQIFRDIVRKQKKFTRQVTVLQLHEEGLKCPLWVNKKVRNQAEHEKMFLFESQIKKRRGGLAKTHVDEITSDLNSTPGSSRINEVLGDPIKTKIGLAYSIVHSSPDERLKLFPAIFKADLIPEAYQLHEKLGNDPQFWEWVLSIPSTHDIRAAHRLFEACGKVAPRSARTLFWQRWSELQRAGYNPARDVDFILSQENGLERKMTRSILLENRKRSNELAEMEKAREGRVLVRKSSDQENALFVPMGKYACIFSSQSPYLKTEGVGPCIGLSLYDPESKMAVLAHFDGAGSIPSFFYQLKADLHKIGVPSSRLQARLAGGFPEDNFSVRTAFALIETLRREGIEINEQNILTPHPRIKTSRQSLGVMFDNDFRALDLVMDTNTGELSSYSVRLYDRCPPADQWDRLDWIGFMGPHFVTKLKSPSP